MYGWTTVLAVYSPYSRGNLMRLTKVLVILCQLVRKRLSLRVLELKQKAFLEAGNNCEFRF